MKNLILSALLICGLIATPAHSQGIELPKLEEPKKPPTVNEIFNKGKDSWNKNHEIAKENDRKHLEQALKERNESLSDREARLNKGFKFQSVSCFRSNARATWNCTYDGLLNIAGTFDINTGKVEKIWHTVYPMAREKAIRWCVVRPEWGKDYVDGDCVDAHMQTLEDFAVGQYAQYFAKSAYRFAALVETENEF